MILYLLALIAGVVVLVKAADAFVTGASATAARLGMSPMLIGMLIVGFGTSAPELLVSTLSAVDGASGIALGNAWGSNVANIAIILGVAAIVRPITVRSGVLRKELPVLVAVTVLAGALVLDLRVSRLDAALLLAVFGAFIAWSILSQRDNAADRLAEESAHLPEVEQPPPLSRSILTLTLGLVLLVASSRAIVWGAVGIAQAFGVSDLVIGLTVVAVGTSLPELASSVAAARRGEDEIAFGNVVGSNMFNTLAVVGLAGVIHPFEADAIVRLRDAPAMLFFTLLLIVFGFARKGRVGRVSRGEGVVLVVLYAGYMVALGSTL